MKKILYVETGTNDVYENLAAEYYIATESDFHEKTGCDTVFLFWNTTPTLVVGKFQNVYEEVNLPYAREHKINIIRRLSGGGTVYYDEGGFEFSFISNSKHIAIDFSEYMKPVVDALISLGLDAALSGRNDILIGGRKISGNAQYKTDGMTVHHGTLLFDVDPEKIVRSTQVADYKIIAKGIKSVRERVTNISEHLEKPLTPAQFKEHMISSIVRDGMRYEFTPSERERIEEIANEKFRSWDCIYGKEPKFSITKTAHFAGGHVQLSFDVEKGCIRDCAIHGDFFATADAESFKKALCGCKHEKSAIVQALEKAGLGNAFYNISAEEIATAMTE